MAAFKFIFVFWLFAANTSRLFSQQKTEFKSVDLRENSFYMVCRGTKQKMGFIAEKFNTRDKRITHVGIGIVEDGQLIIYNVMNNDLGTTALLTQSAAAFANIPDIFYMSVWEYRSSETQISRLKVLLQSYTLKPIAFDLNFNEKDDDKLYCSEFCAKALQRFNPKAFRFKLTKKVLDAFYRKILERTTLYYYPVDFFETDSHFHQIFQQYY